jgi:hypothetical protein
MKFRAFMSITMTLISLAPPRLAAQEYRQCVAHHLPPTGAGRKAIGSGTSASGFTVM